MLNGSTRHAVDALYDGRILVEQLWRVAACRWPTSRARSLDEDQVGPQSLYLFGYLGFCSGADGNHNDDIDGDGIWGGFILPVSEEHIYKATVATSDLTNSTSRKLPNVRTFTSVGPVVVVSADTVSYPGDELDLKLTLKNRSSTTPVSEIKARISCLDTFSAKVTRDIDAFFGNIGPGDSKTMVWASYGIKLKEETPPGTMVPFKVTITSDGYPFWIDTFTIEVVEIPDDIDVELSELPTEFALEQNYPNPFNPSTTFKYEIPKESYITLKVYDILGREVATLVNGQQKAGYYEIDWNASNNSSGVYFYKIQAGGFVDTKKMIWVK